MTKTEHNSFCHHDKVWGIVGYAPHSQPQEFFKSFIDGGWVGNDIHGKPKHFSYRSIFIWDDYRDEGC